MEASLSLPLAILYVSIIFFIDNMWDRMFELILKFGFNWYQSGFLWRKPNKLEGDLVATVDEDSNQELEASKKNKVIEENELEISNSDLSIFNLVASIDENVVEMVDDDDILSTFQELYNSSEELTIKNSDLKKKNCILEK